MNINQISAVIAALDTGSVDSLNPDEFQVGGSHYKGPYQHWDFAAETKLSWPELCIVKYLGRAHRKNGLEDTMKAFHYCWRLMHEVKTGITTAPSESRREPYTKFFEAVFPVVDDHAVRVFNVFAVLSNWSSYDDLTAVARLIYTVIREYPPTPHVPISEYSKGLEDLRRDYSGPALSLATNYSANPASYDYSEPGLKIELAMAHLRESLPNAQTKRTDLAMMALVDGVANLLEWRHSRPKEA